MTAGIPIPKTAYKIAATAVPASNNQTDSAAPNAPNVEKTRIRAAATVQSL